MALRRILPSRVTLPEASPETEHKVASAIVPGATPVTESQPVSTPEPKADIAALGALMADEIVPQSPPTPVPLPQIESAISEPVVSVTEELPQPDVLEQSPPEQEPPVLAEPASEDDVPATKPETPTQPSRPDDNPMRRRPKQPRAFTYTPVSELSVEAAKPLETAPQEPFVSAPNPVADTTPLAEVDDRLQEAGVIPTPMADELTSSLPPAPSVAGETPFTENLSELSTLQSTPESIPTVAPVMEEAVPAQVSMPTQPEAVTNADKTVAQFEPQSSSDLPWATEPQPVSEAPSTAAAPDANDWFGSWNSTGNGADNTAPETTPATPPAPVPTPDLYGSLKSGTGQGGANLPPPEIVGQFPARHSRGGGSGMSWQVGVAAAVVAAALFGAYQLVNKDSRAKTPQLAGEIPATAESAQTTAPLLPPQIDASPSNLFAGTGMEGMGTPTDVSSNAVIAFADIPPDQANKPIVADGTEKMPDDVSFIARLQGAIETEKARKDGQLPAATPVSATVTGAAPSEPSLEQRRLQGEDLRAQLADELAAYRKALADSPSKMEAPKPADFLGQKPAAPVEATTSTSLDSEGAPVQTPNGNLLPPPQLSGGNAVPPAELYKNNPNNLPVVPEPASAEAAKVRQLTDFDVAMFTPERDRIRIPAGIRPHFSTSGFPELEVLSFVPGKGVIAYKDGKEGVLLIGESVDGWELTTVNADNAEFKNGQRSQYVTAE